MNILLLFIIIVLVVIVVLVLLMIPLFSEDMKMEDNSKIIYRSVVDGESTFTNSDVIDEILYLYYNQIDEDGSMFNSQNTDQKIDDVTPPMDRTIMSGMTIKGKSIKTDFNIRRLWKAIMKTGSKGTNIKLKKNLLGTYSI